MRDEQFDSLQRLLSLKKHEVPPPGYFDGFSNRVLARIELQARRDAEGWSWRSRWLPFLDAHRVLAGATALTVAGLGFVGISLFLVLSGDPDGTGPALADSTVGHASQLMAGIGLQQPFSGGTDSKNLPHGEGGLLVAPVRYDAEVPANLFGIPSSRQLEAAQVGYPRYRAEILIEPRRR